MMRCILLAINPVMGGLVSKLQRQSVRECLTKPLHSLVPVSLRGIHFHHIDSVGKAELPAKDVSILFLHIAHRPPLLVDIDLSKTLGQRHPSWVIVEKVHHRIIRKVILYIFIYKRKSRSQLHCGAYDTSILHCNSSYPVPRMRSEG